MELKCKYFFNCFYGFINKPVKFSLLLKARIKCVQNRCFFLGLISKMKEIFWLSLWWVNGFLRVFKCLQHKSLISATEEVFSLTTSVELKVTFYDLFVCINVISRKKISLQYFVFVFIQFDPSNLQRFGCSLLDCFPSSFYIKCVSSHDTSTFPM